MDNSIQLQLSSKAANLSPEILSTIFQHVDWPCTFPLVCKTWCSAVDTHTLSNFILQRYGRSEAIYKAIACGRKRCTGALLRQLIRSGANLSLQLCLAVVGDRTHDWRHRMPWLNFKWSERLPDEAFQALKALAEEQFEIPSKDLLTRGSEEYDYGSQLSFTAWQDALCRTREVNVDVELVEPLHDPNAERVLEALWLKFEISLTRDRWAPFSPRDPSCRLLPRAIALEPRLLPLLRKNGNELDPAAVSNALLRSLLLTRNPIVGLTRMAAVINGAITSLPRTDIILHDIRLFARRSPSFRVSPRVVGEIISQLCRGIPTAECNEAFAIVEALEVAGDLDFAISDIFADVMRIMHGTTSSVICAGFYLDHAQRLVGQGRQLPEAARELLTLAHQIKKVPHNDSESRWMQSDGIKLCGVLRPAPADITPRPPPQLGKLNVDAATDALADLLCNPFTVSADAILREEATKSSDVDLSEAARRAAVRMVRMPSKGATLLGLLTQHPFLLRVVRDEILRHHISLDLLHTAIDPARAIYDSLHPALLSPLAFDYENAVERYNFDLGPSPWVEGYYTADLPPSTSSEYAQSVWPLKPRHYYREVEGQEKVDLGFVTGRTLREAVHDPSDSLAGWTRERLPQGTLPVAIALLDVFDKDDEALDVLLGHAILNLNPTVTAFYLREGVPLRPHHLEALERLGLPRLEAINVHLAEQEAKKAEEASVKSAQTAVKHKRQRGGARARRAREKAAVGAA